MADVCSSRCMEKKYKLNLQRQCAGYYSNTAEGITITVSTGVESNGWQLVITNEGANDGGYILLNEWFDTKRSAYEFAVNWLMYEAD